MSWVFDWSGGEPQPGPLRSAGDLVSSLFRVSASSENAAPRPDAAPLSKLDKEAAAAAESYQPLISGLFMLVVSQLVGDELKPDEATAGAITRPLIRIFLRHVDVARTVSPDARDALAAAGAFALYLQAIYPYWAAKRAERKVKTSGRAISPGAPAAPGNASGGASGVDTRAGAGGTRAGESAGAAPGSAGHDQYPAAPVPGDDGSGTRRPHAANDVETIFAEIGVGGF